MKRIAIVAMASTAVSGVGLFAIAWLATRRHTPAELGFFFTFFSFGALIQVADLGLSYAALQTAGRLAGSGQSSQLPSLADRVLRWNLFTAGGATLLTALLGWGVFDHAASTPASHWLGPWIAFMLSAFASQLAAPSIALREGSGDIEAAWRLRVIAEAAAASVCLLSIHLGGGLWSLALMGATRAVVLSSWLIRSPLPAPAPGDTSSHDYSMGKWMSDVWPFQWKIGVSALSGFLIFRAFAPVILLNQGPVAAGQFGLAISMMNLLIAVTTAWPASQAARFAAENARSGFQEMRRDFSRMLASSTFVAILAAVAFSAGIWSARELGVTFALRFPESFTTTLVLSTAVIHHVVICFAVLLRAEGREPLLVPSIVGGVLTLGALWVTARSGSLRDIALANLVCASVGVPVVIMLVRSRIRFHRALPRETVSNQDM